MNAEHFLKGLKYAENHIQCKQDEIEQLRSLALSVTAQSENEPVKSSSDKDKIGKIVAEIADLERERQQMIFSFTEYQRNCVKLLEEVRKENHGCYLVLHKRYISYKTLKEIYFDDDVNYSYAYIKELHRKGLKIAQKIFENFELPL